MSRLIAMAMILPLAACASPYPGLSGKIISDQYLADQREKDRIAGAYWNQRVHELLQSGAMFPGDRAEVELDIAIRDLQYLLKQQGR